MIHQHLNKLTFQYRSRDDLLSTRSSLHTRNFPVYLYICSQWYCTLFENVILKVLILEFNLWDLLVWSLHSSMSSHTDPLPPNPLLHSHFQVPSLTSLLKVSSVEIRQNKSKNSSNFPRFSQVARSEQSCVLSVHSFLSSQLNVPLF